MRIIYFGTSEFAVPALEVAAPHVVLVVSQPDRPTGRGMKLTASPVKRRALELGLPVETPEKSRNPEFVERLRMLEADFLLVASYGQILSLAVLGAATQGGINLHGSILPKYRGAAPIQRCLMDGETETGVTLMQMDRGMDTGDMIAIEKLAIGPDETYGELQTRLAELAAAMTQTWMGPIASGSYPRLPQDPVEATHAAKITREDTEIRFQSDAQSEYNRFRALAPVPGTWFESVQGRIKLLEARPSDLSGAPGQILSSNPAIVALGRGSLEMRTVLSQSGKKVSGTDFLNGLRIGLGASILPGPT